ncbi:sulfate adenylyltransferase subunit 1 [Paraliomyxa miuraensis]|uniref:sulfate adenylyltransferase subunit 1 n=1 Tax=Paraliomyxa miuraensis TaxID=376150 RepID=UPI00225181AD|nr:GTP-binding protein [Paraliomyxa miuraensis]MCX4243892.1 GTP-binding protein [Paraliomyxa miuraensis]
MKLLRLTTAGSVDDGKSTLIGRLLYDSKNVLEDQLVAVQRSSERHGDARLNLALLTDGLRAEREQGITIDVAYRYFATGRRKFILADTPGHVQYTRNMVTGASTAEVALLLVDARRGVLEQTCRHAFISSLLGIRHFVLCVNKMDLVDFSEERFTEIVEEFIAFMSRLDVVALTAIPLCALDGDNVVNRSERTPWYEGPALLYHLEHLYVGGTVNHVDARFPVQWVIRPHDDAFHDFRGYAGQVAGGVFKPGDEVVVLPSGFGSRIDKIWLHGRELPEAYPPQSVCMTLCDDVDVSRGDMIVKAGSPPTSGQDLDVMLCWLSEAAPLRPGAKLLLRHTTRELKAVVREVSFKVDVNTLHRIPSTEGDTVAMNDIARVKIRSAQPIHYDRYARNRLTGSLVLVDPFTNATVAAGMIR